MFGVNVCHRCQQTVAVLKDSPDLCPLCGGPIEFVPYGKRTGYETEEIPVKKPKVKAKDWFDKMRAEVNNDGSVP